MGLAAAPNAQSGLMCSKVNYFQQNPQCSSSPAALKKLVVETCKHPRGSAARQKGMTQLIRLINQRLWHTSDVYYGDALQQTWIYFCRNLCEATTGRAYDPEVANPVTWLNAYLKRRLQDFKIAEKQAAGDDGF